MISNVPNKIFKCTTPLLCNTKVISLVTHLVMMNWKKSHRQTSYICSTSVGNKHVGHSDVVGASPVRYYYIFILDLTAGFKGLGKDKCKARWESFKFWDLMNLILEVLRYNGINHIPAFYILTAEWHVECSITNNVIRMNLLYTPQMGYISEK